jgi:hypothetical protein
MATKKDYILVAKAINRVWNGDVLTLGQMCIIVDTLSEGFRKDNPKFDQSKFQKEAMRLK